MGLFASFPSVAMLPASMDTDSVSGPQEDHQALKPIFVMDKQWITPACDAAGPKMIFLLFT